MRSSHSFILCLQDGQHANQDAGEDTPRVVPLSRLELWLAWIQQ